MVPNSNKSVWEPPCGPESQQIRLGTAGGPESHLIDLETGRPGTGGRGRGRGEGPLHDDVGGSEGGDLVVRQADFSHHFVGVLGVVGA